MKIFFQKTAQKLFGAHLEIRIRLFNILAAAGTIISLIAGVSGIFLGAGLSNFLLNMFTMILSAFLLRYSYISGKYQLCYTISVICIFLGLFPAIFFSGGGYHSGMPSFFIFAVLFTVFMLDGRKMILMTFLELALYTFLCIFAYRHPETINFLSTEADFMIDIVICFIAVSIALGVTMTYHLKLYIQRQNELEAARKQVEEYAKMKSELFAGMSHEMRTPLTVMSAYAQFAVEQIRQSSKEDFPGANEQTIADLSTISDEANRLAEMADGTLKILMSTAASYNTGIQKNQPVNMGDLTSRLTHLMEPVALRKGKKLQIFISEHLPVIYGDADALTQLVWNILHNAIIHSDAEIIKLNIDTIASYSSGVTVTVSDNGGGIDSDILPYIFERGISGKNNGSGIGLSICREIARQHNGDITIQSSAETGTSVTVQLRGLRGSGAENVS